MKNRRGNEEHEKILKETINEYEQGGWRVIDLEGKSPDAIATKDNKIIAIEILGKSYKNGKWKKSHTTTEKEDIYYMFDEVVIKTFIRGNLPLHKKEEMKLDK